MRMDLDSYIEQYDTSSLINDSDVIAELEAYIKELAQEFEATLQHFLDLYYISYSPSVYKRTYNLENSLFVSDFIQISTDAKTLTITIGFKDSMVWGNSLFYGSDMNKVIAINNGWQVKKNVWFKDIPHLGYYEGYHFIEKAKNDFLERINDSNVSIDIEYP